MRHLIDGPDFIGPTLCGTLVATGIPTCYWNGRRVELCPGCLAVADAQGFPASLPRTAEGDMGQTLGHRNEEEEG